ncbi:PREDICTED: A-kinase anchor protein 14 [Nanorana parkeri]|uniref:A-kinase anchor protein 14 n=1 Tax=Nanorana parkeri TaxID=125878 RepID=UPI00085497FE|nr:PREDICTED: A-kinase anchor protein 14 [Nanorana parkeri]
MTKVIEIQIRKCHEEDINNDILSYISMLALTVKNPFSVWKFSRGVLRQGVTWSGYPVIPRRGVITHDVTLCYLPPAISDKMDSEESYIAALTEKACELVETAIKNAQECLRSLHTATTEDTITEQKYTMENISWAQCKDFTVDLGKKQIEEYVSMWEFHESWLYCTDFLKEEEMEFSKLFHYRMRWSIPTCRKPIPRATACVYFTIKISKIKPPTLPVEVFFVFESNRLVHRPGQTRFREKWLKDIIESKMIMMDSITF